MKAVGAACALGFPCGILFILTKREVDRHRVKQNLRASSTAQYESQGFRASSPRAGSPEAGPRVQAWGTLQPSPGLVGLTEACRLRSHLSLATILASASEVHQRAHEAQAAASPPPPPALPPSPGSPSPPLPEKPAKGKYSY